MTMVTEAVSSAATSATDAPNSGTSPVPGWTISSTPTNPAATAPQRHLPVGSPSTKAASTAEKIGTENPIAVASASGSMIIAAKLSAIAAMPSAMRPTCAPTRRVRSGCETGPGGDQPDGAQRRAALAVEQALDEVDPARRGQLHQREHHGEEQRRHEPQAMPATGRCCRLVGSKVPDGPYWPAERRVRLSVIEDCRIRDQSEYCSAAAAMFRPASPRA